ncbi:GlcG/HbpS family heme-binding protein [Latilactobacillus curvatus]|uniref:Cobalamin adenosyltransferase n=1 Tax=Latilactobacillus curvatus TaxID=28038 RepID=A0AAC9XZH9_LATCU|nr:heme-binding protein [Latilactobacillus curvatus]ASN59249.1 cobalamin adenosyltransferase [Latilactobacillus curvatus]MDT3394133.1 heme-binding protein [Bacillota bacterium]QAR34681.1 heme-binding protein [Latilactobacillus curvatus]
MAIENILTEIQQAITNQSGQAIFSRSFIQSAFDAGEARANELGVGVTMCVTDANANPIMLYHMPNANLVSLELAPKKAWSAIAMKMPTKEISEQVQPGAPLYDMSTMLAGKLVTFAGGIPLTTHNTIIGGVGVSGGSVEEDQSICQTIVTKILEGVQ